MSSSLILYNNNESSLNWIVICDKKWILYNWQQPAKRLHREEAPKCFPKPNFHQKMSWLLFGALLQVWSTRAFWIPAKALNLRSILSKAIDALKTARPAVGTGQQNGPNSFPWKHPTTAHTLAWVWTIILTPGLGNFFIKDHSLNTWGFVEHGSCCNYQCYRYSAEEP